MLYELCFATNNSNKIEEVQRLLPPNIKLLGLEEIGCEEELKETRDTIEGNSLQKASYVHDKFNIDCFADDTGLEVNALKGAPGVLSARYAGTPSDHKKNIELLLKNLTGKFNRIASFRTIITLMQNKVSYQFEGSLKGVILEEQRGSGGFGYDPIFLPDQYSQTLAEMSLEEKNKISHRALAVKKLVDFLSRQSH